MFSKTIQHLGFALLVTLTLVTVAFAQQSNRPPITPSGSEELLIPHTTGSVAEEERYFGFVYIPNITQTVIAFAGALAFLFLIIGGIQILTAYGNEEKVSAGKKTITYAIIGLLVAMFSYAIVSIISAIKLV